jgi:hypothetical protein
MAKNHEFWVKKGAVGKLLEIEFFDRNEDPVDLTGWNVRLLVTSHNSLTRVIDQVMTIPSQVGAALGKARYNLTLLDTDRQPGDYDIEVVTTDPGGNIDKYPTDDEDVWGTMHIIKSK